MVLLICAAQNNNFAAYVEIGHTENRPVKIRSRLE